MDKKQSAVILATNKEMMIYHYKGGPRKQI